MMYIYSYVQYISSMTERPIYSSLWHTKITEKDLGPNGNTLYHFLNVARVNSGKTIARPSGLDFYWEEWKEASDVKAIIHCSQYYQSAGWKMKGLNHQVAEHDIGRNYIHAFSVNRNWWFCKAGRNIPTIFDNIQKEVPQIFQGAQKELSS